MGSDKKREIGYVLSRNGLNRWCVELDSLNDSLRHPYIEIDGDDAFLFHDNDSYFCLKNLPEFVLDEIEQDGRVLIRERVVNRDNSSISPWGLTKEDVGRFYDVPVFVRTSSVSSIKDRFNVSEIA